MATPTTLDTIRTILLAFLCGVATPLAIQLFATLRELRRTARNIEQRFDEESRKISSALSTLHHAPSQDVAALLASAAVPAVMAGIQAFRANYAHPAPNGADQPTYDETKGATS